MDFNDAASYAALIDLIRSADILIVNFKKGDAEKFKLDYPRLNILNPALIYGVISGFGIENDRVAYDLILQAESGFMSMNGTPESGPVKMPVALIDLVAGHQLKAGILTALYKRDLGDGKGKLVHVSLYESAIASLANQATNWLMGGKIAQRIGSTHPNIAPYGELFKTADDVTITFAIGSTKQFTGLCRVLGTENLLEDSCFNTNTNRVQNREALAALLQVAVSTFKAADLIAELHQHYVPVAQLKDLKMVFEDEQANDMILTEQVDDVLTKRIKTVVFSIDG